MKIYIASEKARLEPSYTGTKPKTNYIDSARKSTRHCENYICVMTNKKYVPSYA
jgi:hypothetical protein